MALHGDAELSECMEGNTALLGEVGEELRWEVESLLVEGRELEATVTVLALQIAFATFLAFLLLTTQFVLVGYIA
jgi:hypothetical protein